MDYMVIYLPDAVLKTKVRATMSGIAAFANQRFVEAHPLSHRVLVAPGLRRLIHGLLGSSSLCLAPSQCPSRRASPGIFSTAVTRSFIPREASMGAPSKRSGFSVHSLS